MVAAVVAAHSARHDDRARHWAREAAGMLPGAAWRFAAVVAIAWLVRLALAWIAAQRGGPAGAKGGGNPLGPGARR